MTWRAVTDHNCVEKGWELCPALGWYDAGASCPLNHGIMEYPGLEWTHKDYRVQLLALCRTAPKVTPCVACLSLQPDDSLEHTSTTSLPLENPH